MPTSKTVFEAFDGKEFSNESAAKEYEKNVRRRGSELLKKYLNEVEGSNTHNETFLKYLKSYSDDDAWQLINDLYASGCWMNDFMNISYSQDPWVGYRPSND